MLSDEKQPDGKEFQNTGMSISSLPEPIFSPVKSSGLHGLAQIMANSPSSNGPPASAEAFVSNIIAAQQQEMMALRAAATGAPPPLVVPPAPALAMKHTPQGPMAYEAIAQAQTMETLQAELSTLRNTTQALRRHHAESLAEKDKACGARVERIEADAMEREREMAKKLADQAEQAAAQRELDHEACVTRPTRPTAVSDHNCAPFCAHGRRIACSWRSRRQSGPNVTPTLKHGATTRCAGGSKSATRLRHCSKSSSNSEMRARRCSPSTKGPSRRR